MEEFGASEAVRDLYLGTEVTEDDDGGRVGADKDGPDEEFKMLEPFWFAAAR